MAVLKYARTFICVQDGSEASCVEGCWMALGDAFVACMSEYNLYLEPRLSRRGLQYGYIMVQVFNAIWIKL